MPSRPGLPAVRTSGRLPPCVSTGTTPLAGFNLGGSSIAMHAFTKQSKKRQRMDSGKYLSVPFGMSLAVLKS